MNTSTLPETMRRMWWKMILIVVVIVVAGIVIRVIAHAARDEGDGPDQWNTNFLRAATVLCHVKQGDTIQHARDDYYSSPYWYDIYYDIVRSNGDYYQAKVHVNAHNDQVISVLCDV